MELLSDTAEALKHISEPEEPPPVPVIKPRHGYVVLRHPEMAEKMKRRVILPKEVLKDAEGEWLEVVSMGPGHLNDQGKRTPVGLSPGDRVILGPGGAVALKNVVGYFMCPEESIMAVVVPVKEKKHDKG
jgi:co-chaperonin GroES (HSP10)